MAINEIAFTAQDREILVSLIGQFLPHTPVWAFGSRVKGTSHPWSDLDLAAFTRAEQRPQVSLLKEALEESNLPFRVDLLEWDGLPECFKENINAEHVVLHGGE
jgi:predicted nucleotidyltransferase